VKTSPEVIAWNRSTTKVKPSIDVGASRAASADYGGAPREAEGGVEQIRHCPGRQSRNETGTWFRELDLALLHC